MFIARARERERGGGRKRGRERGGKRTRKRERMSLQVPHLCEDSRPHARSMCAACFCPCISLSRATPLGRSSYQTSEFPTISEFLTELPTHNLHRRGNMAHVRQSRPELPRDGHRLRLITPSTSPIRNTPLLGPCSRTIPKVLWWSQGGGAISYERGTPPPLSSEYGTCKTVKAWLSGKSPGHILSRSLFARTRPTPPLAYQ